MNKKLYLCDVKFGRNNYGGFTKDKKYEVIGVYEGGFYVIDDTGKERQMSYNIKDENYWKILLKNEKN